MFNFNGQTELAILGLLGLGLYAQSNEINLANNTSMLLVLFLLFLEHEKIEELTYDHRRNRCCDNRNRYNNCCDDRYRSGNWCC